MRELPYPPRSINERVLAQHYQQEFTGLTGTLLTADEVIAEGQETLYKNNARLRRGTDYTVNGREITLTTAALSGDVFLLDTDFRSI